MPYLKYGSYQHETNEADVSIARVARFNSGGQRIGYTETWRITGRLHAADQAAITAAINSLRGAYLDGNDLTLFLDNGTAMAHSLTSVNAIGGTRVIEGPEFREGAGAEYSTFRTYQIAVEADIRTANVPFLAWTESVSFQGGGGAAFVHLRPLTGLPQKQQVAQATTYRATQSGSAVGELSYPSFPGPLWFSDEIAEQRQITYKAPKRAGLTYVEFEVSWSYSFESAIILVGFPNLWP